MTRDVTYALFILIRPRPQPCAARARRAHGPWPSDRLVGSNGIVTQSVPMLRCPVPAGVDTHGGRGRRQYVQRDRASPRRLKGTSGGSFDLNRPQWLHGHSPGLRVTNPQDRPG